MNTKTIYTDQINSLQTRLSTPYRTNAILKSICCIVWFILLVYVSFAQEYSGFPADPNTTFNHPHSIETICLDMMPSKVCPASESEKMASNQTSTNLFSIVSSNIFLKESQKQEINTIEDSPFKNKSKVDGQIYIVWLQWVLGIAAGITIIVLILPYYIRPMIIEWLSKLLPTIVFNRMWRNWIIALIQILIIGAVLSR